MTISWPQEFTDPNYNRIASLNKHRKRVREFFVKNRPSPNMSEWIRLSGSVSRQRIHQIENHMSSVTQKIASQYANIYNDDPLRIQLRTGECPPDLAYLLGWELWEKFKNFLENNLLPDLDES